MLVEVYGVKLSNWTEGAGVSKDPMNRRLVELTGARLRPFRQQTDKCEIKLPNGTAIICAGTYDEIVARIDLGVQNNAITRVTEEN